MGDVASIGQATPPWLLWGNTQIMSVAASAGASLNEGNTNTLVRIAYNRPETWRFLFAARIISAPQTIAGQSAELAVWFELITGIGRSAIQIPFFSNIPDFNWDNGVAVPPPTEVRWLNQAFIQLPGPAFTNPLYFTETITGQDLTVVAHARFATDIPGAAPCVVEVSGQFAPNVHVRPDWSRLEVSEAEQFAGGETGGR